MDERAYDTVWFWWADMATPDDNSRRAAWRSVRRVDTSRGAADDSNSGRLDVAVDDGWAGVDDPVDEVGSRSTSNDENDITIAGSVMFDEYDRPDHLIDIFVRDVHDPYQAAVDLVERLDTKSLDHRIHLLEGLFNAIEAIQQTLQSLGKGHVGVIQLIDPIGEDTGVYITSTYVYEEGHGENVIAPGSRARVEGAQAEQGEGWGGGFRTDAEGVLSVHTSSGRKVHDQSTPDQSDGSNPPDEPDLEAMLEEATEDEDLPEKEGDGDETDGLIIIETRPWPDWLYRGPEALNESAWNLTHHSANVHRYSAWRTWLGRP